MAFRDVTNPDAVVWAIREFDALGRAAFLRKYGFSEARGCFVEYQGNRYDLKAIAAAAHGFQWGEPLESSEFRGGESTVAAWLERLGFSVLRPVRLPDWARDELILALDVYLKRRSVGWSASNREVQELSDTIRGLRLFSEPIRANPTFRNPAGVALKLSNFQSIDPEHHHAGMSHGARGDQAVWDEWAHRPARLHQVALAILRAGAVPELQEATEEEEELSSEEGQLLYRQHRRYERDRGLVRRKKQQVFRQTGQLACEVCGFDSRQVYGAGVEVIDVHHLVPLHEIGRSTTQLPDLALVCPTCHRVLHAHRPPVSLADLRTRRQGMN